MKPFWEAWAAALTDAIGSLGTEIVSGLLLVAAIVLVELLPPWLRVLVYALIGSFLYERFIDPNKWCLKDFLQRAIGIAIGVALCVAVT